jgi:hypothetical protein
MDLSSSHVISSEHAAMQLSCDADSTAPLCSEGKKGGIFLDSKKKKIQQLRRLAVPPKNTKI